MGKGAVIVCRESISQLPGWVAPGRVGSLCIARNLSRSCLRRRCAQDSTAGRQRQAMHITKRRLAGYSDSAFKSFRGVRNRQGLRKLSPFASTLLSGRPFFAARHSAIGNLSLQDYEGSNPEEGRQYARTAEQVR
jgi:hypothetical protein